MKVNLKNKMTLVLGLLTIIFFISSISFFRDAAKQKKLVNQTRQANIELEEKILNLSNRNTDLEQKVTQLQETINQEKANYEAAYQGFNQEITRLKEEIEKLTKLNRSLEEKIKETQ